MVLNTVFPLVLASAGISICTCSIGKTLNFLNFISTWHVENYQMQRDGNRLG